MPPRDESTERIVRAPEPPARRAPPSDRECPAGNECINSEDMRSWMIHMTNTVNAMSSKIDRLSITLAHEKEKVGKLQGIAEKIGMVVILGVVGALMALVFRDPKGIP